MDTSWFDNTSAVDKNSDDFEDYKEEVFDLAYSWDDDNITYNDATMFAYDLAGTFGVHWEHVLGDFEKAIILIRE